MMLYEELSGIIIKSAIEVHKYLGPGLFETVYEDCIVYELEQQGVILDRQKVLPVIYKGINLEHGYRIDILVQDKIIVEVKAVHEILPVHHVQILTYMKLSHISVGILINFNVKMLKDGIKRFVFH